MAADGDDSRKATGGWPYNEGALRLDELPSSSRICEETRRDYKGIRGATPTHREREREGEGERGRESEGGMFNIIVSLLRSTIISLAFGQPSLSVPANPDASAFCCDHWVFPPLVPRRFHTVHYPVVSLQLTPVSRP
jgi:hypothetical protein